MRTLMEQDSPQRLLDFDGSTYDAEFDQERLTGQWLRVFQCMRDGKWRTLEAIKSETGDPEASISARLRDFRKPRFGKNEVQRRHVGERKRGLFEYRLVINDRGREVPNLSSGRTSQ